MTPVQFARLSAITTLAGLLLSGPVGILVAAIHPQPPWRGAEQFVQAFHPIQTFPYFAGFILITGSLLLIASLKAIAPPELAARANTGLAFAAVFASIVSLNYVLQTTVVPMLARRGAPEDFPLLSLLTMANPQSLAWSLEMWGYGALGAATWLIAPVFRESRLERGTAWLFFANGPVSIVGAVWMAIDPGWVMAPSGLTLFVAWNLLMVAMLVSSIVVLGRLGSE